MQTFIRHKTAPDPAGCRWCGYAPGRHYLTQRWIASKGWHVWIRPTPEQIKARISARFAQIRGPVGEVPSLTIEAQAMRDHPFVGDDGKYCEHWSLLSSRNTAEDRVSRRSCRYPLDVHPQADPKVDPQVRGPR